MLKIIYRKCLNFFLTTLVLIYLFLDELIWERIAEPIYQFIRELKFLHALEQGFLSLNRYAVLTLFLLLFVAVELLGVVAIGFFANGQVLLASVIYFGKIPITAFTFWLFQIAKAKLLTFMWFKFCYKKLLVLIHIIKASNVYLGIKVKVLSVKNWIKGLLNSALVRRIKAMLGFKLD